LLVNTLGDWKERSASSAMAMDIFKQIVLIEELSPLKRLRKSKPLRKRRITL